MASTRDHADVRDISAVSIASAGVAFQMFNAAFWAPPVVADPQDVERRLAAAAVHFGARQLAGRSGAVKGWWSGTAGTVCAVCWSGAGWIGPSIFRA
jgi:hypothetical protein